MKLGIMQPYLFPYLGYWQLLAAVDEFVIYDDVNYIKQGYINRNTILANGKGQPISLELKGASSNKLINEIKVGNNRKKLLKTIVQNYKKSPYYKCVIPVIEDILMNEEENLAIFVGNSIEKIAKYLKIDTKIHYSSEIDKNCDLRAEAKVLDICKTLQASEYLNAIGGQELYSKENFREHGIKLNFIQTKTTPYPQFGNEFIPYLSIIDILMFNDINTISQYLKKFELI